MTDHANELRRHANKVGRPAGDTPAVMHAAAAHIDDLERRLREAEASVAELEAERADLDKQEPVFWYRPRSDGYYEGPIHDSKIEQVRRESGAWVPLIAKPLQPSKGED